MPWLQRLVTERGADLLRAKGIVAFGDGDGALARYDVFQRLPPDFPDAVDQRRRHIERERALVAPHYRQRVDQIVPISVIEGKADELLLGLVGLDAPDRLVQIDDVEAQPTHALDGKIQELRPDLQDRVWREIGRALRQHPVKGKDHALRLGELADQPRQPADPECFEGAPDRRIFEGAH